MDKLDTEVVNRAFRQIPACHWHSHDLSWVDNPEGVRKTTLKFENLGPHPLSRYAPEIQAAFDRRNDQEWDSGIAIHPVCEADGSYTIYSICLIDRTLYPEMRMITDRWYDDYKNKLENQLIFTGRNDMHELPNPPAFGGPWWVKPLFLFYISERLSRGKIKKIDGEYFLQRLKY
jgi:hypothetical protein